MSSPSVRWSLVACAVLAAIVVFFRRDDVRSAEPVLAPHAQVTPSPAELVVPVAAELASREALGGLATGEPNAPFGSLVGRVLLHPSFAGSRSYAWLEREGDVAHVEGSALVSLDEVVDNGGRVRMHYDLSPDEPLALRGADLEFAFEDVVPGRCTLILAYVPDWVADDDSTHSANLRHLATLGDIDVAAGEPTSDPRLDPLDLSATWMRVSYTVLDDDSVARRASPCHVMSDAGDDERVQTDDRGRIELLLSSRATRLELQAERNLGCVTRAPLGAGHVGLVASQRPQYELHVDPRAISADAELSIFVREDESISEASPFGRGAVYARFDAEGVAAVMPRRLGMHELEWRVKRTDGSIVSFVDRVRTLDVYAGTNVQRVELELPTAVVEALR
jgi:hypothetical protein